MVGEKNELHCTLGKEHFSTTGDEDGRIDFDAYCHQMLIGVYHSKYFQEFNCS